MESSNSSRGRQARTLAVAALSILAWLGVSADTATAQTRSTRYSSAADWNLKAENLKPRGVNPYYLPLQDGAYYIFEEPNFSDEGDEGHYRKEVRVLDRNEPFDIPSIGGRFECAIVEEKEFLDGKQFTKSHNYYCIDAVTNTVHVFGETAWESASRESADMSDTVTESWRAGVPDDYGLTEPGIIAPGSFNLGAKYIVDGAEGLAFVGAENMESGLTLTTPSGTFPNCVRTREFDILDPEDETDKWYCLDVGIVRDTSDGSLVEGTALKTYEPRMTALGPAPTKRAVSSAPPKISEEAARKIASEAVPGEITDFSIERKHGDTRYVVEIIAEADGAETDVIIDMQTGEVIAVEN